MHLPYDLEKRYQEEKNECGHLSESIKKQVIGHSDTLLCDRSTIVKIGNRLKNTS